MKQIKILFLIMIISGIYSAIDVTAGFYNIKYDCINDTCVEGENVTWNIIIENKGPKNIEVITIELKNLKDGSTFAKSNVTFNPHTDQRGDLFVIQPGTKRTKTINGTLPKANDELKLDYYLCFTNAVLEQAYAKENVYTIEYCYKERIESMPSLECTYNESCKDDEFCKRNRCLPLKCGTCQNASFHMCTDYECCSSDQCKYDEECMNNRCVNLDCDWNETYLNNSCVALRCSQDKALIDHKCVDLSCKKDEAIYEDACKKLNCSRDEFIYNHTCSKLNCSKDEFIYNHTCSKLNCLSNETFFNHTCKELDCFFFQKIENNDCKNDFQLIIKLSIEIIIIIMIISLMKMDIKKFISKILQKNIKGSRYDEKLEKELPKITIDEETEKENKAA